MFGTFAPIIVGFIWLIAGIEKVFCAKLRIVSRKLASIKMKNACYCLCYCLNIPRIILGCSSRMACLFYGDINLRQ